MDAFIFFSQMAIFKKIILSVLCFILFSACGTVRRSAPETAGNSSPPSMVSVSSTALDAVQVSLEQAHRDWKGTPYKLGGASSKGVDCSSFVHIVFDRYFGIKLPSNTRRQLKTGEAIRKTSLRTGDLVFFRTERKTLHVGIIVEDDQFLHASTSKGVMISSLSEHYWSGRYLASRRVFE